MLLGGCPLNYLPGANEHFFLNVSAKHVIGTLVLYVARTSLCRRVNFLALFASPGGSLSITLRATTSPVWRLTARFTLREHKNKRLCAALR